MSKFSLASLAVGVVVLWYAAWAAAAPTTDGKPPMMALEEVKNSAVCPLTVETDDDHTRVPRRIKMLKCAAKPNPVCHEEGMMHACCRSYHLKFNTECREVTDTVLVRYKGSDELKPFTVSVGCTCVVRPISNAEQDG